MKKTINIILYSLIFLLTGCFKDYEERYLFEDNRIEFNDAVVNSNASGKTFPILGPIPADNGKLVFQVNMTGKQLPQDLKLKFRIIPEETTAVEGRDYTFPNDDEFTIPANSSFGQIEVNILPGGSGSPTIALELLPTDDVKVMTRYNKIACRFVYMLTAPDPSKLEKINDITVVNDFELGTYNNQNIGYFADLSNYNVYTLDGANKNQDHIDMVAMFGASTGMNLLLPSSTSFTAWAATSHIPTTWTQRNDGVLMRIPNPETDELAHFENATTVSELLAAYSYFSSTITSRAGYNSTNDGPSTRIRNVGDGDLVIYYSAERGVVTLLKVKTTATSSSGSMIIDAKTGQFNPNELVKTGNLTIEAAAAATSRGLVDFASISTYGFNEATTAEIRKGTDIAYIWSTASSTNYGNFIPMKSSMTGWSTIESSSGTGALNAWAAEERNEGDLIHFDNATDAELQEFANIMTRDQLIAAYNKAKVDVVNRANYDPLINGPTTNARIRRPEPTSIIFFKSGNPDRDLYAVMVVNSLSTSSTTNRRMELLIKSDLK